MSGTPRRAVFDDLRVGQLVAWPSDNDAAFAGRVVSVDSTTAMIHPVEGPDVWFGRAMTHPLTVLRDAPAPPVTVRREDYDALVSVLNQRGFLGAADAGVFRHHVQRLIDHADLGGDDA